MELTMTMAHQNTTHVPAVSEAEIQRRADFADGALGAADHEITAPALRAIDPQSYAVSEPMVSSTTQADAE